jgi:hypothetical protein
MKYVVKEPPKSGHVVDAEKLMREFNRAMAVTYQDIDQNNVSNLSIKRTDIASPMSQPEVSTSIIGRVETWSTGPGVLSTFLTPYFATQGSQQTLYVPTETTSGDYEERTENKFWQYVETSAGTKLTLETMSLSTAAELTVIANGQIGVADEDPSSSDDGVYRNSIYDVRIIDNGMPLDSIGTFSVETNNGFLPFHVSVRKLFSAGDHEFLVQIRDRSNGKVASTVQSTVICAYGFVR